MAKLRVKNIKKVISNFRREVTKVARDKETRMEVGEIVVEDIQDNPVARAGKVTQQFRRYFEKYNSTDPKYKRSQINITFTGELMEDLKKNVKVDTTGGKLEYVIRQSDKQHKNYKSGSKKPKKKIAVTNLKTRETKERVYRATHNQVRRYVEDKGYEYLKFSQRVIDKLGKFLQNKLYTELKKKLEK